MSLSVSELPRAQSDKRSILLWLLERTKQGAAAWLNAYDAAIDRLRLNAASYGPAPENQFCPNADVRQIFFKTRRGRIYRILFLIDDSHVFVLRVRGPGQSPVDPSDLATES